MTFIKNKIRVFVAGHRGMVGSAIVNQLSKDSSYEIVTENRNNLDLLSQKDVSYFFKTQNINQVYLAAAKVGGIIANQSNPANFIYENLTIQSNIIHSAHIANVQKLLFLGSSCIYPKYAKQPMQEDLLLSDLLEPTNEPYAIAKIAGIKLCESYNRQHGRDYRSVMPANLYGPNDNFHSENSHVIPAMIRRFDDAVVNNEKEVVIWGSGKPMREFLYVDDMAAACVHVINLDPKVYSLHTKPMISHINVGTGTDCTIIELAETIAEVTGFKGELIFDISKPDGAPRKLLDVSKLKKLGWQSSISLKVGLKKTYKWFLANKNNLRGGE